MPSLKHPLTGAIYTLRSDGLVDVDNNGLRGVFYFDGRHHSGDLHVCRSAHAVVAGGTATASTVVSRRSHKVT